MSRRALLPLAAVAAVAAVGGAVWAVAGAESGSAQADDSTSTATATVERRDLVQRETVGGTLGYADASTLYAHAPGTVTGLPEPGSVVERGEPLYRLDGKPVTLMYGDVPMWRPLDARSEDGSDIEQLERNLVELGYDPYGAISVDEAWGDGTTAAVERWQDDLGLPATGAVQPGQIVFLPGARRIGDAKATRGAPLQPGAEVLETSSTRRIVTVDLDADDQTLVSKGDPVRVELPDGRTVAGTVSSIGRVAESEVDPASGQELDPTVPVEIRLSPRAKPGSLDQAPVDVSLEKERVENALTVPVGALLALVEGGYAVEVVGAGGTTRLVRVEPGAFVDGTVEITGKGIEKGMKVVVPA